MADLTQTSQEWWELLLKEARRWYDAHVKKTPLERLAHEPEPSDALSQKKWERLEKRASTMLLMAIPEAQREEMVATKQTSAMKIVCISTGRTGGEGGDTSSAGVSSRS